MPNLHAVILLLASGLVPKEARAEWLAEWRGELWQLRKTNGKALGFCLGSFRDAYWLRQHRVQPQSRRTPWLQSPAVCLTVLALVAALSLFFALRLPKLVSNGNLLHPPGEMFLMLTGMACILLPAVSNLSLGEYPARLNSSRRWFFLAAKVGLVLPVIYSACIAHFYSVASHHPLQAPPQLLLAGAVLTFRWILNDQRRRCPVCLRLLGNAAQVGQPARNFLEWNGTELVCTRGHGLLHVPATPVSWSATQKWLELDPSWRSLFPKTSGRKWRAAIRPQ